MSNGGRAVGSLAAAECPFVVEPQPGHFYLFRTFNYFERPKKTGDNHGQAPMLWTAVALMR